MKLFAILAIFLLMPMLSICQIQEAIKSDLGDSSYFVTTTMLYMDKSIYNTPNGYELGWAKAREPILIRNVLDKSWVKVLALNSKKNGYMLLVDLALSESLKDSIDRTINKRAEELERKVKKENQEKVKKRKSALTKKFGSAIAQKLIDGQIWIGMTKEMAETSKGTPNKINRTVTSNKVTEQWVYDYLYLYFTNGILESYQD